MKKIFLLGGLLLCCLLLATACDSLPGGGLNGDAAIMGIIQNLEPTAGQILPVTVFLAKADTEMEASSIITDDYIAQTTAEPDANYENYSFSFNNIPAGEYYVAAYKDLNGNGLLDIEEHRSIDAFGYYGQPEMTDPISAGGTGVLQANGESSEPIIVIAQSGETTTDIDFPISPSFITSPDNTLTGTVYNGTSEFSSPISGIEVAVYGTAGIQVSNPVTTDANGKYHFDGQGFGYGEYYIKATSDDYMPSLTPVFYILPEAIIPDPVDSCAVIWKGCEFQELANYNDFLLVKDITREPSFPEILMYTEDYITTNYGYTTGNNEAFLVGKASSFHGRIMDIHSSLPSRMTVSTNPAVGEVVYLNEDFLPDETLTGTEGHGWFMVDGITGGKYTIKADDAEAPDYVVFFDYDLILEEDTCTTVELGCFDP